MLTCILGLERFAKTVIEGARKVFDLELWVLIYEEPTDDLRKRCLATVVPPDDESRLFLKHKLHVGQKPEVFYRGFVDAC